MQDPGLTPSGFSGSEPIQIRIEVGALKISCDTIEYTSLHIPSAELYHDVPEVIQLEICDKYREAVFGDGCDSIMDHIEHLAISRYLQIWGPMDMDRLCRALGAVKNTIRLSFSGMIGHLNVQRRVKKVDGCWVRSTQRIYLNICDLPDAGVETARMIARTL